MEGGGHGSLLRDVGISIMGAAAAALPAYLCRVPLMLAYLGAGVALGPLGFKLIQDAASIETLSSIGLILLMFILGLEIDIGKLLQAGKAVIINGITQFVGCVALGWVYFGLLGYDNSNGSFALTYLAVASSLSSTLIVVKILSDRMELDTLTSRITLGILVLQDLWAIAFLAVQPNLKELKVAALAESAGRALLLVAVAAVAARFLLPPIFRRASRMPELVLVLAMAWCFASCGLANYLGLSAEMGALVAGVCIASFPYHTDIAAKVSALRDFFITLFFVALGLRIEMPTEAVLKLTGIVVVFLLVSRLLTVFPVLYLMRYGNRASLVPAINLSQISEFSLVLAAIGVQYKHITPEVLAAFILALVVTALLSSFVIPSSHSVYRALNPILEKLRFRDTVSQTKVMDKVEAAPSHGDHPQIVLLGFYREASSLLQELLTRHPADVARKVLVVDFNPEAHQKLTAQGIHCKYGDLSHPDTLRHLELDQAR
ncbi:MAG TPA: cation:proton antiporter, partial [Planctomycetota bacterium]|nr:cation:proton antiporter [Planctomycetota bacterium]